MLHASLSELESHPGEVVCQLLADTGWHSNSCLSSQYGVEWAEREPCLLEARLFVVLTVFMFISLQGSSSVRSLQEAWPLSCANMNHSLAPASNRAAAPGTSLWGSPGTWVWQPGAGQWGWCPCSIEKSPCMPSAQTSQVLQHLERCIPSSKLPELLGKQNSILP